MKCGGKCMGARATKARYERQAQRRKKLGKKKPLDKNWRNSSYACTCHTKRAYLRTPVLPTAGENTPRVIGTSIGVVVQYEHWM